MTRPRKRLAPPRWRRVRPGLGVNRAGSSQIARYPGYIYSGVEEAQENAALVELLGSISDRKIRRKVLKLLQFGEEAVRSLGELDSALYLREDGEEQLQIVADAVLSHVRRLLEYLGMVAAPEDRGGDAQPAEVKFADGDSLDGTASSRARLAAGFGSGRGKSDGEKWAALVGEMDSLQFALGSEIKEFDRRFSEALKHDRKEQAVTDIYDATTSLMDGVFAVMTTVYECFLGYAEPERMIPGHRDTLGKALAVRRALAILRREVREVNQAIQDRSSTAVVFEASYKLLFDALVRFMQGDTFAYLRSDDRKEFEQFYEQLSQGTPTRNRRVCEGFDKYLDSLSVVSQRGVLIKHDTDLRAKIAKELKQGLAYAKLLPEIVCDVIHQSFLKGERLFGLNDRLDALILRWFSLSEDERYYLDEAVAMGEQLRDLVQPPQAPPPADGDFL